MSEAASALSEPSSASEAVATLPPHETPTPETEEIAPEPELVEPVAPDLAPDPATAPPTPDPELLLTSETDCGSCEACADKVKFGGSGKKRKGCLERAKAKEEIDKIMGVEKPPPREKSTYGTWASGLADGSAASGGELPTGAEDIDVEHRVNIFEGQPVMERRTRERKAPVPTPPPEPTVPADAAPSAARKPPSTKLEIGTEVRVAVEGSNFGATGLISSNISSKGYYDVTLCGGKSVSMRRAQLALVS